MEGGRSFSISDKEEIGGVAMLKGVPGILSPELLKVLCEMGHSDRLVIADGNFPAESMGKDAIVIRMDGHGIQIGRASCRERV